MDRNVFFRQENENRTDVSTAAEVQIVVEERDENERNEHLQECVKDLEHEDGVER